MLEPGAGSLDERRAQSDFTVTLGGPGILEPGGEAMLELELDPAQELEAIRLVQRGTEAITLGITVWTVPASQEPSQQQPEYLIGCALVQRWPPAVPPSKLTRVRLRAMNHDTKPAALIVQLLGCWR